MSKTLTPQQIAKLEQIKSIEAGDAEINRLMDQMQGIHKTIMGTFRYLGENGLLPEDDKDPAFLTYLAYLTNLNKAAAKEGKESFLPESLIPTFSRSKTK